KPAKPPNILTTKGAEQTRKDCAAYDDSSADYRSGEKAFSINRNIYIQERMAAFLSEFLHSQSCSLPLRLYYWEYVLPTRFSIIAGILGSIKGKLSRQVIFYQILV